MKSRKPGLVSIKSRIFLAVLAVFAVFLLAISLMNQFFLKEEKTRFIYDRLREASETGRPALSQGGDPVAGFTIRMEGSGFTIPSGKLADKLERQGKGVVLDAIARDVLERQAGGKAQGMLDAGAERYFYYAVRNQEEGWSVFLSSLPDDEILKLPYAAAFLLAIFAAVLASEWVSRRIVKPMKGLESFAEQVSQHHWQAAAPASDLTEINHLAQALDRMKATLQEAQERERQFLQASSHNLKTPVMVIKGYAQAMQDNLPNMPIDHIAEVIRLESENLEHRVVQMLALTTYGHVLERRSQWTAIRLDRLLNSLVHRFAVVRGDVAFSGSREAIEFPGDSDALRTAFENLLENSIRFAINSVKVDLWQDEEIHIRIANDGPPFTVEDPGILFERYKKDGSGQFGLGLAIAKQVIEGHGGSIQAGNLEKGVYFEARLPAGALA